MKTMKDIAYLVANKCNSENIPDFVKPVCLLSGSYYQMGYQFGEQLKENLYISILHLTSKIMLVRDDQNVIADMYKYEEVIKKQSPELLEMFQGTADALGLPLEAIYVYAIPNLLGKVPANACSTISTWGKTTSDGKLYCGANADGGAFTPTSYGATMILYPKEKGNIVVCNGGYNSNLALNEKGLVTMASNGGWNGRKNDIGFGTPAVLSTLQLSLFCDTAEEAVQGFTRENTPVGSAENFHCADPSRNVFVIESTYGHFHVRTPGEQGEDDYILATNFFLSDEMQSSKPENTFNDTNSVYRYNSEEQAIKEHYGSVNIDVLDDILSSCDYYDGSEWIKNVWDEEKSRWTPEKRSLRNATYMQCFANPEEKTVYLRQGERCTACSNIPDSTGGRSRIVLKDTPEQLVEESFYEAKKRLYDLCGKTEIGNVTESFELKERREKAKKEIWRGDNLKVLAITSENLNDKMYYLSNAMTAFSKAQILLDL